MKYPSESDYLVFSIIEIDEIFYPKVLISERSMWHDDYWTFIDSKLRQWKSIDDAYGKCRFKSWEDAFTSLDKFRKMMNNGKQLIIKEDFLELKEDYEEYSRERELSLWSMGHVKSVG